MYVFVCMGGWVFVCVCERRCFSGVIVHQLLFIILRRRDCFMVTKFTLSVSHGKIACVQCFAYVQCF